MRYPHLISALRSAKWAITESTFDAILSVLHSRLVEAPYHSGLVSPADLPAPSPRAWPSARVSRPRAEVASTPVIGRSGATAVVPFHGICAKRISAMEADCGGVSLETLQADLVEALSNPRVARVVLHLDSPGGTVTGIPELAARIREWSKEKPIYAYADNLCASAAYWLGTGCEALFASPTADVGSIGVFMLAIDSSEAFAKAGFRAHLIKAGARKAEGVRGVPIAPETLALWQQEVDELYAMFTAAVTAVRPGVQEEAMQGQTFMGSAALGAGLVDDLFPDLDSLLVDLDS